MITGVLNCILLSAGILFTFFSLLYFLWHKQWERLSVQAIFLVFIFLVFFAMHTAFWALGIFGSFGLIRVFIAIACVMTLVILSAIEYINHYLAKLTRWHTPVIALSLVILFPLFASNNSPYSYGKNDFSLHADEITDNEMAIFVKKQYPDYKSYHLFYDACYLSEVLDVDIFDDSTHSTNDNISVGANYPSKSLVIWDDWYSDFEHNTHLETLRKNKSLREIKSFENPDPWNQMRKVVLFVSK